MSAPSILRLLILARAVRAFADGLVSVLLPLHLLRLGYDAFDVGVIATATLLGSAMLTLAVGLWSARLPRRAVLLAGCGLMVATGLAFFSIEAFWALVLAALIGTLNPSVGDVSLFLPAEQARMADLAAPDQRTAVFARYGLFATLAGAVGTLAAEVFDRLGWPLAPAFLSYVVAGVILAAIYVLTLPRVEPVAETPRIGLSPQARRPILVLTALFCIDAFGGGFVLQSLIALWLFDRFGFSLADASRTLFVMALLGGFSQLAAPWVARRIGLVNTMVFTHLPANLFLMLAPFAPSLEIALALLFLRSALSSMDVAPRTALVLSLVPPTERAAATSVTAVPRALAAAGAPIIAGWLLASSPFGWAVVVGGGLKAGYDVLLLLVGRRLARERGADDVT
ncbi:MFS transporter [Reyranella sp. CPCC 100927]|uniref:MFS transporter n=1 Tax=Reyranella sp. CPCC 100927 TaxID=2599616 RepID=UPI00210270F1|nr:MFS transporter [Reyranella sp. CPCC 100927]